MNIKKELLNISIISLPIMYLAISWDKISDRVPLHWNFNGEVDRYGSRTELALFTILLPIGLFLFITFLPKLDPKNKLSKMGMKFNRLKTLTLAFVSIISIFIIYISFNEGQNNLKVINLIIGFFIMVLGNYFQTIKPNYFIGIKTPWTLESEEVWNITHKFAGKLWFVAGTNIMATSLMLHRDIAVKIVFSIIILIVAIPIIHSYLEFKKLKT